MITEDYISFETSRLMKEKGFDEIDCDVCLGWIGRSGRHYSQDDTFYDDEELKEAQEDRKDFIPLITLQMAVKWLEEVHHILVVADYEYEFTKKSWYYKIYKLGENGKPDRCAVRGMRYDKKKDKYVEEVIGYRDYERSYYDYDGRSKACEEGIRYVLEKYV